MFAAHKTAVKPQIVLLGQKKLADDFELQPEEGPFESFLAVAQDMWGVGNLTPLDNVFASAAVGALAVTTKAIFGTVCYQLGDRLFNLSREIDVWIDAFECEPALSEIQKWPKDKVKLIPWKEGGQTLPSKRFTKLAVLHASRIPGSLPELTAKYAASLKSDGQLFLADLVAGKADAHAQFGGLELRRFDEYKDALKKAQLTLSHEYNLDKEIRGAILRGLYNSINMLANIRMLKEPWKGQRLAAFYKELDSLSRLYRDIENGDIAAVGILAQKP
ncbi:MAG: hypothetical protein WCA81_03385 [Rhizomicrobium sp.]|jgi:hypothetical protein